MNETSVLSLSCPVNERIREYRPGTAERESLEKKLRELAQDVIEIPCLIGGKEVRTGNLGQVVQPHSHREVLAKFHYAGEKELRQARDAALAAKAEWESMPWSARAAIFLKAADLLAGPYRDLINAATMLGQSKNAFQSEIDAACELIDFLRFNAYFYQGILKEQPISSPGVWNRVDYRPLEGFVLAITPFNFTAIAGNLAATPAMLGNTVVWKPSDTQVLSGYYTMKVFEEAGLPPGVINFVPADGPLTSKALLGDPELAGVHFTGSTATFRGLMQSVAQNLPQYRSYPRMVGETGGKDFVFAHPSAECEALTTALVRGAFEYQGQKCSAASRAYLPRSLWKKLEPRLLEEVRAIRMGDVRDFKCLVNAVIDERSFKRLSAAQEKIRASAPSEAKVLIGGQAHGETGYFVEPTIVQAQAPKFFTMEQELFGPILTVFVYEDSALDETLTLCDQTSPYALTGAVFAQDRVAVEKMMKRLRHSAGNFYINDKPTGAVVGQQPFGGARASGTNDKAGSSLNLHRWLSPRTIKDVFLSPRQVSYPFMK